MAKLYDLCRFSTATTGTGTLTVGSAVSGFLTPALAGASSGDTVSYGVSDGANSEVGRGVLTNTSGTWTLSRGPIVSTNSNAAIALSGSAQVFITALAEDFVPPIAGAIPAAAPSGQILQFSMANLVPPMTSDTAPSGVASCSTTWSTTDAWFAFTYDLRVSSAGWLSNNSPSGWVQYQFPTAQVVKAYEFVGWSADTWNARCPAAWTFQGSNDGSTWTTLDTQAPAIGEANAYSGISPCIWGQPFEPRTFFCMSNTTAYLYYRINISNNMTGAGFVGLGLFKMFGAGTPTSSNPASIFTVDEFGNYGKLPQATSYNPVP